MRRPIARDINQRKRAVSTPVSTWVNFTPASLPSLVGWWDADDENTFTYSSGTSVSQWNDKTKTGWNLTQAVALSQPSRSTTLNGHSTVSFDGSNDFLLSASITSTQPLYVYAAFVLPVDAVSDADLIGGVSPTTVIRPRWQAGGATTLLFAGATGLTGSRLLAGSYVWGVSFNGTSSTFRLNGVSGSVGNAGTQGLGQFRLGRGGDNNNYLNVEVAEILVYTKTLSAAEVNLVESYLNSKWAIY